MTGKLHGLSQLLSLVEPEGKQIQRSSESTVYSDSNQNRQQPILVPIAKIISSPFQPRTYFDAEAIAKMADDFRQYKERGEHPPTAILVRPFQDSYQLVFGERRVKAHKLAGFSDILAFVNQLTDVEAQDLALTENLMREDLNPVERTEGILNLLANRLQKTPDEVKTLLNAASRERRTGACNVTRTPEWFVVKEVFSKLPDGITPESFRTNHLPLLNLPEEVLHALHQGEIEYTKAKIIGGIKDPNARRRILNQAIAQDLSITKIRELKKQTQIPRLGESNIKSISERANDLSHLLQGFSDNDKNAPKIQVLLDQLEKLLTKQ